VSITVTPVNDRPTADDQAVSTLEDTAKAITLTGGDIDGDGLSFAIGTGPTHGALTGTPPDVTYTPAADYNGTDSFTFTTSDGVLTSLPATVSITVTPTADPVLTMGDASTTENDSGTVTVTAAIAVSEPSPTSITVDFATADGSVTSGLDYVAASGSTTIPALASSHDLVLEIVGDLMDEPDETFTVTLSNAVGATIGTPATGTVTIFDNDPMPELAATDVIVGEAAGTVDVTLSLDVASGFEVTVDYATVDGSAVAPDDYTPVSGTATIPVGMTTAAVIVPIVNDIEIEVDESFGVEFNLPINAVLMTPTATVTIIDDDGCNTAGDADGNCVVDAADLALIILIIDDPLVPAPGNPDCTGDGAVDGADLVCVAGVITAQ
jgi:hypothetical protein